MTNEKDSLLTTELLLHRLHAGLGIAGGARGSLTKAASTFNPTDLQLQQLELTKLLLTSQRNAAELAQLEALQKADASPEGTAEPSIAELRSELQRLEQVQSCLEEYEALAKLTVDRHAVSELQLQRDIRETESQHARAVRELHELAAACRVRQGQFHVLQQCLQDLQQSLQEQPLTLQPHEVEQAAAALHDNDNEEEDGDDDDDAMDVENEQGDAKQSAAAQGDREDDEDDALYRDL